jgi:7,8-dihydropterin-6-yl-methyl-4-(beta-D-ribofuranosyl)aminobenzene 5'-phosphate synthase
MLRARALGYFLVLLCAVSLAHAQQLTLNAAESQRGVPARVVALKVTILSTMLAEQGIGEWGFAALVEADGHKMLFDTGARPRTVLDNARELGIDLSDVEDVILSHFHDDHTTGLMTLRRELSKISPKALSRVHVAPEIFLPRRGEDAGNIMIAMKKDYEASGGKFIEHSKPQELFPGVWLTGPVARVYPEKNYGKGLEVLVDGKWIEDNVPDDMSLIINSGDGLIVLTGCGHAGIINILQYTRSFLPPRTVYAIIGGLHLFTATEEQLAWTARKMKEFHVAQILGAHCTGIEAVYRLRALLELKRGASVVGTVGATFDLKDGIRTGSIAR